ncbi:MAG TPA: MaoC family dehydratase N-terminal domain-containing protein [Acidimicrobiales bacterium]|nr:MaoC family dehydratase N-terminal domain-containing protein [Acidimicrobiales bacterium]
MSGPTLDTTDVDRYVGVPLGGGQMKDPVAPNDVRRWAQAMQNANPLHYDDAYASESRFGGLVAPQSFAVATDTGHGATPAIQGVVPGTHMLFGGDEWWFFGPRIYPGDRLTQDRMLFDYKVTETKFAGPTMFSRGDTTHVNQRGELVCKQRSTSIRYMAEEARKRMGTSEQPPAEWTDEQLADLEQRKLAYYEEIRSRGHAKRLWDDVSDAEVLPTRPLGPHSVESFTTEWRAFNMTIWGAVAYSGVSTTLQAGWLPEMTANLDAAQLDPALRDGLYRGPSRGHTNDRYARLIGMPRGYGYGASMGAWILDYLANWGGEWATILHSNSQYRSAVLTGDATFLDGKVTGKYVDEATGDHVVRVAYRMTNQAGAEQARGAAEIAFPAE